MIVTEPQEVLQTFLGELVGRPGENWSEASRSIGWVKDHKLKAVVLYNHFSAVNCCMNVAAVPGRHWLAPEFLFMAFNAPFLMWGLKRVTALIPKSNLNSQRFNEHVGFQYEGEMRYALPNGDSLLIYGLLKEDCRWIRDDFAKRVWLRMQMQQNASSLALH